MGSVGLFKRGWKRLHPKKQAFTSIGVAAGFARERLLFLFDRHWPLIYRLCVIAASFLLGILSQWRECAVGGVRSVFTLGPTALFVILWSCFLCLASTTSLVYVLLSLGAALVAVNYLSFTPGLFIVGHYGVLIIWIYGYFWMMTILLITAGYMFSLNRAYFLIFLATAYSIYSVYMRVGLLGVLLSMNLSFISNYILNKMHQRYNYTDESIHVEVQKDSEPVMEDFSVDTEYSPPITEPEHVECSKSACTAPEVSSITNTNKDASPSKVVVVEPSALVEMRRIMSCSNHYEVLGFLRNSNIDPKILKKEYRKKVLLVHPDKNLGTGSSLACESFDKLKFSYEVLSDLTKKKYYDEQLRKEEPGRVYQRSSTASQKVEFCSKESRRIECTKCGNSHTWICTNRNKARARWCQDCLQYHRAKDGDGWVETRHSTIMEIPRAYVCAESRIFDVSHWAICQGISCKPNIHGPTFHVNKVSLDRTQLRSNPSRYPWGLYAEMITED
ncbi:uncharacterized protein LOC122026861 isoform X1 [Zingiber officinale]|uniref:uncharacterized protein LOC122026861 isoform X1 n=1 Tax=Zingiber officinale TaxID=94328 RepID=UPI001C4BC84A|nr:uncharacterized protein LOC122026861 isoform X1 [Zingiber officinale]